MKQSGDINHCEETGTEFPVTSKYGKTPPNKHGCLGRQQHATTSLESCPALSGEASTIRTTALALNYYVAEYTVPVWARSAHAYELDS